MVPTRFPLALWAALVSMVGFLSYSAEAGLPEQIRAVVPADARLGTEMSAPITTDFARQNQTEASLVFNVRSLPKQAKLLFCAIRVVISEQVGGDQGSGVEPLIVVKDSSGNSRSARIVRTGTKTGVPVVFQSTAEQPEGLCPPIKQAMRELAQGEIVLKLSTETPKARVSIYTTGQAPDLAKKPVDAPSVRPRLMLVYSLPESVLNNADWTQLRHDAQHTGRSDWSTYDPVADPTAGFPSFIDKPRVIAKNVLDITQSPTLFGGTIFTATDTPYGLEVLNTRFRFDVNDQPKYLAGGPGDMLYLFRTRGTDIISGREPNIRLSKPLNLADVAAPTIGADNSVYAISDGFVHAYAGLPGMEELWRHPAPDTPASAVALSRDEATAYVLFGGLKEQDGNKLVALDTATGACRWSRSVDIEPRKKGEELPILVVAGQEIYFTNSYPTGTKLFAVHDTPTGDKPFAASERLPDCPAQPAANADKVSRTYFFTESELKGMDLARNDIVTPVIGLSKCPPEADASDCDKQTLIEAVWLNDGKLCWAAGLQPAVCDKDRRNPGSDRITLLIGERPGNQDWVKFYGLAPGDNASLFAIRAFGLGTEKLSASFQQMHFRELGPNLVLGPDGTFYNKSTIAKQLVAIDIKPTGAVPRLTLTPDTVGVTRSECDVPEQRTRNNNTVFRAEDINVASDLCLPPGADIILNAGQKVRFATGFGVKQGARLRVAIGVDR
jgi:hypothetical protein